MTPDNAQPDAESHARLWVSRLLFGNLSKSGMARVEGHLIAFIFVAVWAGATPQLQRLLDLSIATGKNVDSYTASLVGMAYSASLPLICTVGLLTLTAAGRAFWDEERGERDRKQAHGKH